MKKLSLLTVIILFMISCNTEGGKEETAFDYPTTRKDTTVIDTYFGTEVKDPYRWLEDDNSAETKEWVKQQNKFTNDYLSQITFRDSIKNRLEKIWNYERKGAPFKEGDYFYYYKNDGLQNQYVIYRTKDLSQSGEEFINPNTFSADGTVSMSNLSFSKSGKKAAYQISEGGSDWHKIIVIDTESKKQTEDTLVDIKFSNIAWYGEEGFYYSSYDKPKEGSRLSGLTKVHKLYYHKLNTPQSKDILVFGGKEMQRRYISGSVTDDLHYLIVSAAQSTTGNELYIKDLTKKGSEFIPIQTGYDCDIYVLDNVGSKLYLYSNLNAPNGKLETVDAATPEANRRTILIDETKSPVSFSTAGGYIFASYKEDVKSKIWQYDYNGKKIREVSLPAPGTAGGFSGKKEDKHIYYSFRSFTYPATLFKYDLAEGKSDLYWKPDINFNPDDFETKQVFFNSKDGTKIPMYIVHKKGIKLNGKNPTYLYAYGGFNISLMPNFDIRKLVWLENGGIYAEANLRGGGEYGEEWHKAGTLMNKQNVFDDFAAAGKYLIENKYTSNDYLAIAGGSNGGLLIGATITQHPDLAKVAFPAVGVLDMLRYHKFTSGAGWHTDYGTADDSKEMFEYLYGYSPLHNVRACNYPATMVTTGDHDDRVVPAHSFKFAATLQAEGKSKNPLLIRIETDAGHGAGTPTAKLIQQVADKYAFAWYNMGINPFDKK